MCFNSSEIHEQFLMFKREGVPVPSPGATQETGLDVDVCPSQKEHPVKVQCALRASVRTVGPSENIWGPFKSCSVVHICCQTEMSKL